MGIIFSRYYYAGWGYFVAFTWLLAMYQIYHTWIHLLNHSPSSPLSQFLEYFQQISFWHLFTYVNILNSYEACESVCPKDSDDKISIKASFRSWESELYWGLWREYVYYLGGLFQGKECKLTNVQIWKVPLNVRRHKI
jgi:hypothetical protein